MKKKLSSIIALVCALTLLGGCGSTSNEYVTIKKYKGLEVEKKETIKVTDEDVEGSIKMELEAFAETVDITDRPAKLGDITNIDYCGKKDGVAFEGGTAEGQTLELGSNTFIDGFEAGVVGHNIGETFDLDLTFPKEYHSADLAGQKVVFTVTLNGIQEKKYPELTDDLLTKIGTSAKTVEEYKAQVKADLEKSNKEEAESQKKGAVLSALIDETTVKKYPSDMISSYVAQIEEDYGYYAYAYQMEVAEVIKTMYGMTIEQLAELQAKKDLAISLVAEKEGLQVSDKEYKKLLDDFAKEQGYQSAEECETAYGKDGLRQMFLEQKVTAMLLENCKFVEPKEKK